MALLNRFLRALGLSALFGVISFLLSAHAASWLLATAIFYYEFLVRKEPEFAVKRMRR